MLGRILAVTLTVGGLMSSSAAMAQSDAAVAAGVVTGIAVGAAIAAGAVPLEQREPLRGYVYREPRPYYRYDDEVAVGRELPPGAYESYPVPEQYGVPVFDGRMWVSDELTMDGHHLSGPGADRFTGRVVREALVPWMTGSRAKP